MQRHGKERGKHRCLRWSQSRKVCGDDVGDKLRQTWEGGLEEEVGLCLVKVRFLMIIYICQIKTKNTKEDNHEDLCCVLNHLEDPLPSSLFTHMLKKSSGTQRSGC